MAKRWADEFNVRASAKSHGLVNQKNKKLPPEIQTAKTLRPSWKYATPNELLKRKFRSTDVRK